MVDAGEAMKSPFTRASRILVLLLAMVMLGAAGADKANPIEVVQLAGDGPAIGKAYGQHLGQEMRSLHQRYLKGWIKAPEMHRQALAAALAFRVQLLPEHKAELLSLAEAGGMDSGELMLGNCFLDLLPFVSCSTITLPAEAAPDGIARFGRNLDFASLGVLDKTSVLLIVRPKDRYAFASVTWPGLIGVLSGMNEHGLTLANMEVDRPPRPPQAMPYMLLYRMVLERCKNVEEAIELLKSTPRQSANNLMLMDAAGNRAVVEITPEAVVVRRGMAKAALISTNHQRGQDQDSPKRCWRYDRLHASAQQQFGQIDPPKLQALLASVAQGDSTLQSMIFEPSTRVLYLATGAQAPKQPYQRIDLAAYFAKP